MFHNLNKYQIVLASNSPRRKSLLAEMGVKFETQKSQGEETYPNNLAPNKVAEFLARQKADWFTDFSKNQLYITADTVVILDDKILGKPAIFNEAVDMLSQQSGNWHQVITGVCIKSKNKEISFSSVTDVLFKTLTQAEIEHYVKTYKPFDKAGAYGIQEWIGMIGIEKINGSYFNVVGLPTDALFNNLKQF
jgi:septum formation protein